MNNDLISREALKEAIEQGEGISWDKHGKDDLCVRKKYIDNAPTVEPERPKGEWVEREYRRYLPRDAEPYYNNDTYDEKTHSYIDTHIVCSECGAEKHFYHNFCGNCGADMRGDAKNE